MRIAGQLDGMPELLRDGSGVRHGPTETTWSDKLSTMRLLYRDKCNSYWKKEIDASGGNMKKLWRTLNGVLGDVSTPQTVALTADDFASFFQRRSWGRLLIHCYYAGVRCPCKPTPTMSGMLSPLTRLRNWSAQLRVSLVSWIQFRFGLLRRCVDYCHGHPSSFCCVVCNKSLTTGCFPVAFKSALIRPLLKKNGVDSSQLKNYWPVSSLSFLSKLLREQSRFDCRHSLTANSNNLMPVTQSAYRQYHSTETAVTKFYNDMLLAADSGQLTALCLFDLTAAFDTYCCFVWSDSLVSEVSCCSGSVRTLLAGHFVCCTANRHLMLFTLRAPCHMGRC